MLKDMFKFLIERVFLINYDKNMRIISGLTLYGPYSFLRRFSGHNL